MAFDVIPVFILIGCLMAMAVMIGRKLPQMKTLDVESIPAERELRLKRRLLASRLRRHLRAIGAVVSAMTWPLRRAFLHWLKRGYQRVMELESRYRRAPTGAQLPAGPLPTVAEHLFQDARRLWSGGQPAAAEEKLMQLIELDPRHEPAYELLGDIYLASREYVKAREVYTYLVKLLRRSKHGPSGSSADRLATGYLNLAMAHHGLDHPVQALPYARKAVALAPSNPRVLDFLLKISIVVKDKALAEKTWQSLQQADPGNAKLPELKQQIDQLP